MPEDAGSHVDLLEKAFHRTAAAPKSFPEDYALLPQYEANRIAESTGGIKQHAHPHV